MQRIGMATIGQSPRDDLVPNLERIFTKPAEILQLGALDDLDHAEIGHLSPKPGEAGLVVRLRDGSSTVASHSKLLPLVQCIVDKLVARNCNFVVILCAADWSSVRSLRLVINPGKLFRGIVSALASNLRLGIITPLASQMDQEVESYRAIGIDAMAAWASPYTGTARLEAVRNAAKLLRAKGVGMVWMLCPGMDNEMRMVVEQVTGRPTLLARSLLARLIDELLTTETSKENLTRS